VLNKINPLTAFATLCASSQSLAGHSLGLAPCQAVHPSALSPDLVSVMLLGVGVPSKHQRQPSLLKPGYFKQVSQLVRVSQTGQRSNLLVRAAAQYGLSLVCTQCGASLGGMRNGLRHQMQSFSEACARQSLQLVRV
jgi:hypothetical protein